MSEKAIKELKAKSIMAAMVSGEVQPMEGLTLLGELFPPGDQWWKDMRTYILAEVGKAVLEHAAQPATRMQ